MPLIDQPSQLAALIRAKVSAQFRDRRSLGDAGASERGSSSELAAAEMAASERSASSAQADRCSNDDPIGRVVAQRVRALRPDDPQRSRKAFRIFLESVLLHEFGRDRVGDPTFHVLIDQVLERMEKDEDLNKSLTLAGASLLERVASG